MKIEWSRFALADRDEIFNYIEAESPKAAVRIDACFVEQVKSLMAFPNRGRQGRIAGTRELVITTTPYIVTYCVGNDAIRILRVLHGAQAWPDDMQG
jgi:toxin ParE1/3/4